MPKLAGHETLPVREAQAGEPAAWELLYRRYQLPLYAFIQEMVRHEQLSLDLVQETFIRAARHIGGLRAPERFGSWLFGIAHQLVRRHARRHAGPKEHPLDLAAGLAGADPGPDALLIRREEEAAFRDALQRLSAEHREVLLLHYLEDFSLADIAAATGAQAGTVKSRLHYARRALRQLMEVTHE